RGPAGGLLHVPVRPRRRVGGSGGASRSGAGARVGDPHGGEPVRERGGGESVSLLDGLGELAAALGRRRALALGLSALALIAAAVAAAALGLGLGIAARWVPIAFWVLFVAGAWYVVRRAWGLV